MITGSYHIHLDTCERCSSRPFDLCAVGARLLEDEARAGEVSGPMAESPISRLLGGERVIREPRIEAAFGALFVARGAARRASKAAA